MSVKKFWIFNFSSSLAVSISVLTTSYLFSSPAAEIIGLLVAACSCASVSDPFAFIICESNIKKW